jgi:tRNA (cytidine/uridine-2'-O-)-methyltransferase
MGFARLDKRLDKLRESYLATGRMFQIVLFQPEIPPNTGNAIRLAANTGCVLHLVEPLGFDVSERSLRRAGLDYHEFVDMRVHPDWAACLAALGDVRRFAFSTKSSTRHDSIAFRPGDAFIFGPETRGLPAEMLAALPPEQRLRLPMMPGNRSLNLSNTVAVAVYEAWRQQGFAGSV